MGCANSKLDDLPAVALCRDRCASLDEAIHHRYALAEAHIAYMQSLKGVGFTLRHFFDQDVDIAMSKAPLSPLLPLPKDRKGGDLKFTATGPSGSPEASALPHHLHSNSGSHLQFHSDSDDDDGSHGSLPHSGNSSPLHYDEYPMDHEALDEFPSSFMNMNYMKNQATPAVTYEQRPMGQETVYMGESSHSAYRYPYPYPNSNPNPSSYPYNGYQNYGGNTGYFGGPQAPYGGGPGPVVAAEEASSSKPPPPPPSPPSASAWDFLNPFESYEKFYPHYTPSRNSKDVRDEEGIPDLEDDYQHEDVKEVHGDQKFVGDGGGAANYSKSVVDDEGGKGGDREALYQTRPKVSADNSPLEFEVHMVEKKVVDNEDKAGDGGNVAAFKGRGGSRGVPEVLREIQAQFDRASESGSELAKMLEVGKLPYHRKHVAYQVSSKMLHVITPLSVVSSHPSTSTNAESSSSAGKAGSALLDFDEDVGMRLKTLSSTLQKLHLWEKKLYNEVKAEEKMRVVHEKKCRKLKHLDERGAEAHKVDVTRTLIRSLSTKIKISIQVVDKISVTINKIRDEELWPRIYDLIHGFTRMWKSMLECHHSQYQAIIEARSLDAIASQKKPSDAHLEATWQLEHELIHWISSFSVWVGAQKGYVIA
ncbi:hypothetical protein L1049_015222 [Liquidambar formosana]|uniref:Uncharacterized protein n=1 Tax=Liquidambar formosana TaxID=63359 RepID=A0AAP0S4E5_LIQFO